MWMHTGPIKVMKWETRFSFVSGLIRVPYGSGGTKLSPRFIGPFRIQEKIGPVAYRLVLPPHLHKTHNVFHVSILRHYVADESHKLNWKELQVSDVGTLTVEPLRILDRRVRQLRNRLVDQVKVQWDKYSLGSATWEDTETLR
jgi:hypothetical protein